MIETPAQELITKTRQTCEIHGLWDFVSPLVVAVSGGMDSMALLHVLNQLAEHQTGIITAAHFDHGGRNNSADDAVFVAEICRTMNIPCMTARGDGTQAKGISPEAQWRRDRYRFLESVRRKQNADAVATAHTADDQVETVLFRLLTGTGPRGLAGMRLRNRNHVIRPFLYSTREHIESVIECQNIPYRLDSTNANLDYPRNYIRHQIIPHFDAVSSGYRERIQSLLELLRGEDDFMAEETARLLARAEWTGSVPARLNGSVLADSHPTLLRCAALSLYEALDPMDRVRMTRDHVTRLVEVFQGRRKNLSLPGNFLIRELRGILHIFQIDPSGNLPETPMTLPECGSVNFGRVRLTLKEITDEDGPETPGSAVFLNPEDGPFRVRRRIPGDRYRPSGKSHSMSLKDYFNSHSVPSEIRDQVPVVVNRRDEIEVVIFPDRVVESLNTPKPRHSLKLTWLVI